ncbi:hypothetical protein [Nocardioides zeae]
MNVPRTAGAGVAVVLALPLVATTLVVLILGGGGTDSVASSGTGCAQEVVGEEVALDGEQLEVAEEIVSAVRRFEPTAKSPRAAEIALATGLQESSLRNLPYGDRDSLGVFQQRPSQGWGTPEQVRDIDYATTAFLQRLVQINRWEQKELTRAAQAVQRSAYPDAYARWETAARSLVERLWPTAVGVDLSAGGEAVVRGGGASGCSVVDAGVPEVCTASGGAAERGLRPNALRLMRCVLTAFGPHVVGGVGERPNASDHPNGRAVDVMIDDYSTPAGNAHGWEIARWVEANAEQFGVTYIIFDDQIWSSARADEGWRSYCHPNYQWSCGGGDTLRHLDHVHVSVAAIP